MEGRSIKGLYFVGMYSGFILCYTVVGSVDADSMSIIAGGILATVGIVLMFGCLWGFMRGS